MSASFEYARRLHAAREFASVLSAGQIIRGEKFELLYRANVDTGRTVMRLGLIVPKRLAKAASLRNALKRQCRETFRLSKLPQRPMDVVVRLSRPVKPERAVVRDMRALWRADLESLFSRFLSRIS